ncbi:enterobactin/ferric enterobactin esterase [Roseovarius gaetbuli]|uniref:Enterobactin/ferric enterobactin esterase n=1 Tax=Roseovarius gaetbuli TaxID=1356575 RepID=A0A1X6YWB3_9RHOB|nr:PHB depolymerase family esterase [Roseovarius gaetbuli]SLN32823.1 enterobactin/ferric enterobactin esterase [Roseovarius gaetbuli]
MRHVSVLGQIFGWILALCLPGHAAAQPSCGGPEMPCETVSGSYHIVLPEGPGPHPVMMFLHGAGGRGASLVRPSGTSKQAVARGYAYIAPNGLIRPGRNRPGWSFHPDFPGQRDEAAFLQEVMTDAATRFNIDRNHSILAGFSIGGSLASYVACTTPAAFTAYAPISGSFWRPHPTGCAGPVRLLHTHGWRDQVVPLEGRFIRQIAGRDFAQGDVFHAMTLWRRANSCDNFRANRFKTDGDLWRRIWVACAPGTALELALFDGGHGVPSGWGKMVLDWFEGLKGSIN